MNIKKKNKVVYCCRCNGSNHDKHNCKFKTNKCRACLRIGHIERACYFAKETKPGNFAIEAKPTKFVKQKEFHVNESEVENLVSLHNLEVKNIPIKKEFSKRPPITFIIENEGKPVKMKIVL